MQDGEPTTCIKFINLHKKSRQSLGKQICFKALFISIQSDPDQNQEWLGCVGTNWWDKFGITNFLLALSGWATPFDFRSNLVNEAIIVFGLIWWMHHPLTTKQLSIELNVTHIMGPRALYWQFCWDLVLSKAHRHYKLLHTRSWSHRQSKLICWQLSKKYTINWIRLWTKNCCQWNRGASRLKSSVASK